MKKFHLFFSGSGDRLLAELQKDGLIEIEAFPEEFQFSRIDTDRLHVEESLSKIEFLKEMLKHVQGKDVSGKILISKSDEKETLESFKLQEVYEKYFAIFETIKKRKSLNARIQSLQEELEDITLLDAAPSELFAFKNFSFFIFRMSKKVKNFDGTISGFELERISEDKNSLLFLVIFPIDKKQEVKEEIKELKGQTILVRRWNKPPAQILSILNDIKAKNLLRQEKAEQELAAIISSRTGILLFNDRLNTSLHYLKAKAKFGVSKFIKGFSGWVQDKDIGSFKDIIFKEIPTASIEINEPEEESVPIALENKTLVEPFEVVTDLYGRPVYKNIDPTGPLSLFFALSFAFCLTDAGYGILLIIIALVLKKKFSLMPAFAKFAKLLLYGGIATVFMGIITGGWFGDLLNRLPAGMMPVRFLKRLVVLDPLQGGETAFIFLLWALVIGYVQIVWGLCINVFNSISGEGVKKSGGPLVLLMIQLLLGAIILSFIGANRGIVSPLFLKVFLALLVLSFIYLMISESKTQNGLMMKIFWALYSAYNVVASNLLGDILSYSRLFGLGLTTAVLGLVVNEMVFLSTGIPYIGAIIGVMLFLIGHAGNLAINLLGGYVHTSRLQYLEFFTKFYESGGRPFSPLKESREYTIIDTKN